MKRPLYFIIAILSLVTFDCRAISPREAFVNAPGEIFTTLDSISRLDMIDYFEAGSGGTSRNALGGNARILALDDNHIGVLTSGSSAVDIYLLSAGKDTTIAVVSTLRLPATDSAVSFYDKAWKPINVKKIPASFNNIDLWLKPGISNEERSRIENLVPFIPAYITIENNTLNVAHKIDSIVPKEDFKTISALIIPAIAYKWNGKIWAPVKK